MTDISSHTSPSSGSDSPSSPTCAPESRPSKRKRASKPKVRTGCITWIRRVKCGEEKPVCLRCTSTGRTCDGYSGQGTPTSLRLRGAQDSSPPLQGSFSSKQPARVGSVNETYHYHQPYQWKNNTAPLHPSNIRLIPIAADINGTRLEKKFFHLFRAAAASGSLATACIDSDTPPTPVWSRVAPRMGYQAEAVKHAVVALGAAHYLFGSPSPDADDDNDNINGPLLSNNKDGNDDNNELPRESLEVFMIQQYNLSISKLQQQQVGLLSSPPESTKVTLVCCLAFIYLERMRSNYGDAVVHLRNGLRILESLPVEMMAGFVIKEGKWDDNTCHVNADHVKEEGTENRSSNTSITSDTDDMTEIIRLFAHLESWMCCRDSGQLSS